MIYPLIVALVAAGFAASVGRQYLRRHRLHQALWAGAFLLGSAGALAYVAGANWHNPWWFKLYYACGALWITPYLGLGSLSVIGWSRAVRRALPWTHAFALAGGIAIAFASVNDLTLETFVGTSGVGVLLPGPWLGFLIVANVFGASSVGGCALYSAIQGLRRRAPGRVVGGQIAIAFGVLAIGVAGSAARLGLGGAFWLDMAVGWVVIFAGFCTLEGLWLKTRTPGKSGAKASTH
jgi:hypothetical protein